MAKLKIAVELLIEQIPLPAEYRDHPLRGNWTGYRDLHIEPNWLILYRVEADELLLARTGRHTDIFDE
jgi:mRNA interferase YafQ